MRSYALAGLALTVELICFIAMYALGDLGHQLLAFLGLFSLASLAFGIAAWRFGDQAIPLGVLLVIALSLRLPMLLATPSLSDDVWRYLHDGRAQLAGVSPYVYAPADPATASFRGSEHPLINHPELPTIYPPAAQAVFALAALLGGTLLSWKLLLLCIDLAIVVVIVALLRQQDRPTGRAALYAWHPLVVVETAGSAHMDALALLPALLAFVLLTHRRFFTAGIALGASIAAKFVGAAYLPFLLRRNLWRVSAGTIVILAVLYGVYAQLGTAPLFGSLPVFARHWESNPSLYALFVTFVSAHQARMLGALMVAVAIGFLLHRKAEPAHALLSVTLVALLVSPVVHPWYLVWLIGWLAVEPQLDRIAHRMALIWSFTVVLAYTAVGSYQAGGEWQVAPWAWWAQYAPVYGAAAVSLLKTARTGFARSGTVPAH